MLKDPVLDNNVCLMTDSYKLTHHPLYTDDTDNVYSYFEARLGAKYPTITVTGLQYLLKEYLVGQVLTKEMIDFAEQFAACHFGNKDIFRRDRWDDILNKFGGHLPLKIKAVPEGTTIPINNVAMTVEAYDGYGWLTNHFETILSHLWYPTTVCTLSRAAKTIIKYYLEKTADNTDGLLFKLHDFGYRGASSEETARVGGCAHLVNFLGTDTIAGMLHALKYYHADLKTLGFSIPATEHSVMTSLGKLGEVDMFRKVLTTYPTGFVAIVSDSYDIYNAASVIVGEKLKDLVLNRNGVLVMRPDSGEPVEVILKMLDILAEKFGFSVNSKGYKCLHPNIRLIWGDGIDYDGIVTILQKMTESKWCTDMIAFGMGGGLLQKVNRDTERFAFKCSAQKRNGIWVDIKKNPIDMTKVSKAGRLMLVNFNTVIYDEKLENEDMLKLVFDKGELLMDYNFEQIRYAAAI